MRPRNRAMLSIVSVVELEPVDLPPPSPPIEATATEQKNDNYNDKQHGHVHRFSVLSQSLSRGILDPARWALNIAGRIFVATPASESVRCSRSKHGRTEEELDRL